MTRTGTLAVVAALAAVLCGCGPAVRIFRGTATTTTTTGGTGGATTTTTTQGALSYVYAGADPNKYLFEVATGASGLSHAWSASAAGTVLTFTGGQTVTTTVGSATTNTTLTGGTGSIDQNQLTLNLQGTTAATGAASVNGTFTISFAGTKE